MVSRVGLCLVGALWGLVCVCVCSSFSWEEVRAAWRGRRRWRGECFRGVSAHKKAPGAWPATECGLTATGRIGWLRWIASEPDTPPTHGRRAKTKGERRGRAPLVACYSRTGATPRLSGQMLDAQGHISNPRPLHSPGGSYWRNVPRCQSHPQYSRAAENRQNLPQTVYTLAPLQPLHLPRIFPAP